MNEQENLNAILTACLNERAGLIIRGFKPSIPLWQCETPDGFPYELTFWGETQTDGQEVYYFLHLEYGHKLETGQTFEGTFSQVVDMLVCIKHAVENIGYALRTNGYKMGTPSMGNANHLLIHIKKVGQA